MTQGVRGSSRPRIFLTFGTTRVAGRQPYAPAAFTPGEIHGTHFQGLLMFGGEAKLRMAEELFIILITYFPTDPSGRAV